MPFLEAIPELSLAAKAAIAFGGGTVLCGLWATFASRWL